MKYDQKLRGWKQRRAEICQHYRQSGSLRSTGKAFDISGERVRQIVGKERTKDGQDHARGSDTAAPVGAAVDG